MVAVPPAAPGPTPGPTGTAASVPVRATDRVACTVLAVATALALAAAHSALAGRLALATVYGGIALVELGLLGRTPLVVRLGVDGAGAGELTVRRLVGTERIPVVALTRVEVRPLAPGHRLERRDGAPLTCHPWMARFGVLARRLERDRPGLEVVWWDEDPWW